MPYRHEESQRHLGKVGGRSLIYVFGSNEAGRHGAGSAKYAKLYQGAIDGQGEGLAGNSYALPTKDSKIRTLPLAAVRESVDRFLALACERADLDFLVSRIGCGLAGYGDADMAPLFASAPDNVVLPGRWAQVLGYDFYPLVISGSRWARARDEIFSRLELARNRTAASGRRLVLIEGGCRRRDPQAGAQIGADYYAYEWAMANRASVLTIDADWGRLGKSAGMARNELLGQAGAGLLAFPTPGSRGTRNMVKIAQRERLALRVIELDDNGLLPPTAVVRQNNRAGDPPPP